MASREAVKRPLVSQSRDDFRRRFICRLDGPAGLLAMFSVALLARILIAPHAGFYGDLKWFQAWATRLAEVGPHRFYADGQFADYPPGYLYVLWLISKISVPPGYVLLKMPAILADLGLAWLAGTLAQRIAPTRVRERFPVRPLVAAAVLFNPAFIMLSAVWGQVDAVPALFVLWTLLLLFTGPPSLRREILAFLVFAVAIAVKPQAGFVLPVLLYALYRRHLRCRSGSDLTKGILSIGLTAALSLGFWFLTAVPFGLGPVELVRFDRHSASLYPVTSVNAFNLWGAVGFGRPDASGDYVAVAGIPALYFGMLAFAAGIVLVISRAHRAIERGADEARILTLAAGIVSLLAFVLLTRMHERYMFYSLALLAPLVFVRPLRLAFAALCGLFVVNLWYPYAFFNSHAWLGGPCALPAPGCFGFDWVFGGFSTDTWQKKVWSVAITAIAFAVAWYGIRWAAGSRPESDEPRKKRSFVRFALLGAGSLLSKSRDAPTSSGMSPSE
jgi:dolichyl-phosphate-mannose-protein mannosyltransferase